MKGPKSEKNTDKNSNNNILQTKEPNFKNKSANNLNLYPKSPGKSSDRSTKNSEEVSITFNILKKYVIFTLFQGEQKDLMAERKKRGEIRTQKLAEDN